MKTADEQQSFARFLLGWCNDGWRNTTSQVAVPTLIYRFLRWSGFTSQSTAPLLNLLFIKPAKQCFSLKQETL